jgi:carboxymethylenebutenolidase
VFPRERRLRQSALSRAFVCGAKRLAQSGYAVLVVSQFYRVRKPPIGEQGTMTLIPDLLPLARALTEATHTSDAKAFIAWLDTQPSVAKSRKIGVQGYCMGGPMSFRTAAVPDRVGAVASFHGGGLVTDQPNSPHLQASKTKVQFLIAIASCSSRSTSHYRPGRRTAPSRSVLCRQGIAREKLQVDSAPRIVTF